MYFSEFYIYTRVSFTLKGVRIDKNKTDSELLTEEYY